MANRRAHYCKRIADAICEQIAMGLPLSRALKEVGPLAPTQVTAYRWMKAYPEFRADYEEALKFQANIHADKILELAYDAIEKKIAPANARFAADMLRWHAEMRDPQQYSPKGAQTIPPTAKNLKEMKEEVARLQKELGVAAQPGMVTAPRVLREKQAENSPPAPNLKVVGE